MRSGWGEKNRARLAREILPPLSEILNTRLPMNIANKQHNHMYIVQHTTVLKVHVWVNYVALFEEPVVYVLPGSKALLH